MDFFCCGGFLLRCVWVLVLWFLVGIFVVFIWFGLVYFALVGFGFVGVFCLGAVLGFLVLFFGGFFVCFGNLF